MDVAISQHEAGPGVDRRGLIIATDLRRGIGFMTKSSRSCRIRLITWAASLRGCLASVDKNLLRQIAEVPGRQISAFPFYGGTLPGIVVARRSGLGFLKLRFELFEIATGGNGFVIVINDFDAWAEMWRNGFFAPRIRW